LVLYGRKENYEKNNWKDKNTSDKWKKQNFKDIQKILNGAT